VKTNQDPNPGASPLPNAVRSVYYDDRGEPYYTEWQLLPEPPAATTTDTGEATVADLDRAA
jgi:hypothetical protein